MDEKDDVKIKWVFCNYGGILIVHDFQGKKVEELSGEITLDKHHQIETRKTEVTEFEGKQHYDATVQKLKKEEEDRERSKEEKERKTRVKKPKAPPQVNPLPKNKFLRGAIIALVVILAIPVTYMIWKKYFKK